jgi:sulfate adenylyltransferase subunit 2
MRMPLGRDVEEPFARRRRGGKPVTDLDELESQSVFILREAFRKVDRLSLLWSIGKDSNVLLWLVRKAFFGRVPFPVIHIDTSYKLPEMIAFRDRMARAWNLDLIIGENRAALDQGMSHRQGRVTCCSTLKTAALKEVVARHGFSGLIAGIRRDEEGTRAKERVFSPRGDRAEWDFRDQPPEFWDHFNTEFPPGVHLRIHPLLHWTELDIWRYVQRESIPVVDRYFAQGGRRYRSLGCGPCTGTVASAATTVDAIIAELAATHVAERAGRAQDQEAEDAFERLRASGYM